MEQAASLEHVLEGASLRGAQVSKALHMTLTLTLTLTLILELLKILTKIMTICILFAEQMKRFFETNQLDEARMMAAVERSRRDAAEVTGGLGITVGSELQYFHF